MKQGIYRDSMRRCDAYSNPYDARLQSNPRLKAQRADYFRMQGDGYETAQTRLERELLARFKFLDISTLKDKKGPMLSQMAAFVLLFPAYLLVVAFPKWLFIQAKPLFKMQKKILKSVAKTLSKLFEKAQLVQKGFREKFQEMLSRAKKIVDGRIKALLQPFQRQMGAAHEKISKMIDTGLQSLVKMEGALLKAANFIPKIQLPTFSLPKLRLPNFSLPKFSINWDLLSATKLFFKNIGDKSLALGKPFIKGFERVRKGFESFLKQIGNKTSESFEKVVESLQRPQDILSKIMKRQLGRAKAGVDAVLAKAKQVLQQAADFGQHAVQQVMISTQAWVLQPVINFFVPILQRVQNIKGFAKKKGQSFQKGKEVIKELALKFQKKFEQVYDRSLNVVNGVVDAILKVLDRLYRLILKGLVLLKKAKVYLIHLAHLLKHSLHVMLVAIKILAKFAYMLVRQMIQDFNRLVSG